MEEKRSLQTRIKSFITQSSRVWKVLRKPSREEFSLVAKVSAIGVLILGLIGFLASIVVKSVQ